MTDDLPDLSGLRDAPPPPVVRVRRRVTVRRNRRRILGIASVVAAVGLAIFVTPGATRDRGLHGAPLVSLDAVAEGPHGARPLGAGATVGPDERVVFFVRSSVPGTATLTEVDGGSVVPVLAAPWTVPAGESVPGGASPLSWRPDRPLTAARYELSVCAAPDLCGVDTIALRWDP